MYFVRDRLTYTQLKPYFKSWKWLVQNILAPLKVTKSVVEIRTWQELPRTPQTYFFGWLMGHLISIKNIFICCITKKWCHLQITAKYQFKASSWQGEWVLFSSSKGWVLVSFSEGCLYTLPLQSQWQPRNVYSMYTQFSGGHHPGQQWRTSLYFLSSVLPDLPILKWIKKIEADYFLLVFHMQQKNSIQGNIC